MINKLIIYQKLYDVILYAMPILNRFPKSQRFVLAQQIQNALLDAAKLIALNLNNAPSNRNVNIGFRACKLRC